MSTLVMKPLRFLWRLGRNLFCAMPGGTALLFPSEQLAIRFGPGDAPYAWSVFEHHRLQLEEAGFNSAERVLEVGPGRNIGTALLWWSHLSAKAPSGSLEIVCWDVYPNANIDSDGYWPSLASALIEAAPRDIDPSVLAGLRARLEYVAAGHATPSITYRVEPLALLEAADRSFDLIYSHAAIEHVWFIDPFWDALARLTAPASWHSHRIDMADHGKRDTNYIELLEWSRAAYWLTMRFIPGATNRWRANHYLGKLQTLGFVILIQRRTREPPPNSALANIAGVQSSRRRGPPRRRARRRRKERLLRLSGVTGSELAPLDLSMGVT